MWYAVYYSFFFSSPTLPTPYTYIYLRATKSTKTNNMVLTKSMLKSFSDVITEFVLSTHRDFYFLTQESTEVLDKLIDNGFDAHLTWQAMSEGSGEDYLWNMVEGSDELWMAKERMDTMVNTIRLDNVCTTEFERSILESGLKRIDFSTIQYNFLSVSDEEDSDIDSDIESDST